MRFVRDRRGQSVVVGTVILFGFLILALSIYQVQFVPAENSEIEFEHSQEVEGDFLDLRNDILSAGTTGASRSTSIRLGTRYPQRTFFLNPPAASGTLQTTQERSFEIRNATVDVDDGAHENVRDFWENGAERGTYGPAFDTRSIRYTSSYNEYQGAPELVYENSLVAAEFGDRVLPRSDQTVLRDERVSLTALSGDISENGVEARSVDSETVSRGSRTIPISADGGGDLEIVLPTDTDNPSDLVDRLNVPAEVTANGDQIVISLDSTETYRLGLSEVSVDGSGSTEPAYIVPVGSEEATAGQSVGVEVRDKYNNPVEGAEVVISDGDDRTTDDDGRVFFNPGPDDSTASINGSFDPNKPGYESVEFAVSAAGGGSGGGESGVGQGGDSTWSEGNTTETISARGGLWRNIGNINSIVLSNLRMSPIDPDGGDIGDSDERFFRLAFTIGDPPDGDERYVVILPRLEAEIDGGLNLANGESITIYREFNGGSETLIDGEELSEDALNRLIRNEGELDLLDPNNWDDPDEVSGDLDTIRSFLEGKDGHEAFITDINGRVDLSLEQRNETMADSTEFVVGSGSTSSSANNVVEFSLQNVGSESVEISEIGVSDTSDPQANIVRGDGRDTFEGGGGSFVGSIEIGGQSEPLDQNAVISAESTEEFSLGQFRRSNDDERPMNNDDITVVVTFADGSQMINMFTAG